MLKHFPTMVKNKETLLIAFFLPLFIMTTIYAVMGVYPFGDNTLLTVDLGQQYVDFFSYYRHTLLSEPSALFYSFTKAIGGDMLGLWAYYLMSPFNLIFLFSPQKLLPVAVTLLILLKIAFSSLTFAYLLIARFEGKGLLVPTFSVSYALMGYVIVNQLNVMWLDGLVFLPLIVLGLERLIDGKKGVLYSLFLGIMLFSNYYIGFMICLFLGFYFLFAFSKKDLSGLPSLKSKAKDFIVQFSRFVFFSALGAGLSALLLLPTFYSLLGSKASYTNDMIDWSFAYPPAEILSKFYIGAFNFDQMPTGLPNVFIGTLALLAFIYYFANEAFSKKERIVSLLLTVFFFLAMNVQFINKLWHAGQYPIWYPYRFSFTICFFFLLNGFRSLQKSKVFPLPLACSILVVSAVSAIYVIKKGFAFLEPAQVLASSILVVLFLIFLMLRENNYKWMPYLLLFLTVAEMTANAAIDLFRLGYVKYDQFNDYQVVLADALKDIRMPKDDFYRIEKTFQRSKNDSFQANYAGINHFSSTFEKEIPALFGSLGFPEGNGFVVYSTGTLFTDALFGVKYQIQDKKLPEYIYDDKAIYQINRNATRPDLQKYALSSETARTTTYENPYALSLAFGVSKSVLDLKLIDNQPILMQEQLLDAFTDQSSTQPFFALKTFDSTVFQNVTSNTADYQNTTYFKAAAGMVSRIEFQFTPETNNPYYLILDSGIDDKNANLYLNDVKLDYYKTYRNDQVINIASNQAGENVTFTIELIGDNIRIQDLKLYEFDQNSFEQVIADRQTEGMEISDFSQTHIEGTVHIKGDDQVLMTTIPYSEGWTVAIDGEPVETEKALDSLLAVPISQGEHQITFTYRTPYAIAGAAVSAASVLLLLLLSRKKIANNQTSPENEKNA
jgi:uncharacterized membrane protein YfhO